MKIRGLIHMIELDHNVIGIKSYKLIRFFYFQNRQMNTFKRYLYQDNWIELEYDENYLSRKGQYLAYRVSYVYKLEAIGKYDHITYYDKNILNNSLHKFLSNLGNTMFLDLEMTMPSYTFKGKGFITEVIQAGIEICDNDLKIIHKYSNYIKPKINKQLSKRAEDFLGISSTDFYNRAIEYESFYNSFNEMIYKYDPAIVVFGKNDQLVLNESYDINNLPSLVNKTRYINLCQLIKNYYELKNDPGLFKLFGVYYDNSEIQIHDALSDSEVTRLVFLAFRKDILDNKYKNKIIETFN